MTLRPDDAPINLFAPLGEDKNATWIDGTVGIINIKDGEYFEDSFNRLNLLEVGELIIVRNFAWYRFE